MFSQSVDALNPVFFLMVKLNVKWFVRFKSLINYILTVTSSTKVIFFRHAVVPAFLNGRVGNKSWQHE